MSAEDLRNNPEIRAIFLTEARKRLQDVAQILDKGRVPPPDSDDFAVLHRHAHTFKGLSATLGYPEMEAHSLEILYHLRDLRAAAAKKGPRAPEGEARDERMAREILEDFAKIMADIKAIAEGDVEA